MDGEPGQDTYRLKLPKFDIEQPNQSPMGEYGANVTREDVFELLSDWEEIFPDLPPFEAARLYLHEPIEVCITSLIDPYSLYVIEAEQACRDYQVLPYDGGLWDQPNVLIEAFSIIRMERNHFERIRFEKWKADSKRNKGAGNSTFDSPNQAIPPRTR